MVVDSSSERVRDSAALADRYDGFLLDLDGVVYVGREPIPGSVEAIVELRRRGKHVRFITNDPTHGPEHLAQRLTGLGLPTPPEQVVPVAQAVLAYLAAAGTFRGASTYVVGTPALKEYLAAAGLVVVEGAAAERAEIVVVGGHANFDNRELRTAGRAAPGARHFLLTAPDAAFPMPDGPWPGAGAMAAAIAFMAGRQPVVVGKPEPWLFRAALDTIPRGSRVAMVGDNLDTDILGAQRAGLSSVLVLSGHTSAEQAARASIRPTHLRHRLSDLL